MSRRKVLYVVPKLERGGAEILLLDLATELRSSARWAPEICALEGGGPLCDEFFARGIPVHCLDFRHRYDVLKAPRLAALAARKDYDVIHCHLFPSILAGALNQSRLKARLIASEHSVWNKRRARFLGRFCDRLIYGRMDRIICVSGPVEKEFRRWLPGLSDKTLVINNGIPIADQPPRAARNVDILFVGNMNHDAKGVDILLRALALLPAPRPRVLLVGDGRLRPGLEDLSDSLGLAEHVRFAGSAGNVREIMRRAKLFVLPSRWEGLPMALLEAMEAGLPIVASEVGGIPEAIIDGHNGLLTPSQDPAALAGALSRLLKDPAYAESLGDRAREDVRARFSIKVHSRAIQRLYEDLLL